MSCVGGLDGGDSTVFGGRLTVSEFGTVGVAHLEAAPGVYQAKLLIAARIAASAPVMVTASGAEFVLQVPPVGTAVPGPAAASGPR